MDLGGDVGSEPEGLLTSKPDGAATMGLGTAATSAHRERRAKAMVGMSSAFYSGGRRVREVN